MFSPPESATVRPSFKKQSGAFDLPSVLIGVAVVAILAIGVMATIFGVIPWAQDRAAKQDLAAVNTAQGTTYAHAGSFMDKQDLVGAGWLGEGTPESLETQAGAEGNCYVAVATAKTGTRFVISSDKPTPRELTSSDTWCTGSKIVKDTAAVMISTWNSSLGATCKEITLPVTGLNGTVDWGDGTRDTNTSHTFAAAGPVTIRIDGTFTSWGGEYWPDADCLLSVDRWGATGTTNLGFAFQKAVNLKHVEDIPVSTTNLFGAFHQTTSDFTIGAFDTSNVTSMNSMFYGATAFNQPVRFNTSKVTSISSMFNRATVFNHLVNFDTSQVRDMQHVFMDTAAFNQPVNFDTSKVTSMLNMFNHATVFNQPVNFDTARVQLMAGMFQSAVAFNQPVNFNTAKVTDMSTMFYGATAFNHPVPFKTSNVTTMNRMFYAAKAFDHPVNFDTARVTDMNRMFFSAPLLNQPLNFTDTSKVTDMGWMFRQATAFNQPLHFNTASVTDMQQMFYLAEAFNQDLSAWNVSKVLDHTSFSSGAVWTLPKPSWVS